MRALRIIWKRTRSNRWKLIKIAHKHQLDATERLQRGLPNGCAAASDAGADAAALLLDTVKQLTRQHGDLVDHQHVAAEPQPHPRVWLEHSIEVCHGARHADAAEGVQCCATHQLGGNPGGCGHLHLW